jgi:hypothetical protein
VTAGQIGNLKMVGHSYMDVKAPDNALTPGRLQSALGLADGRVQNDAGSGSQARFHVGPLLLQKVNPGPRQAPRVADAGACVIWWGGNDAAYAVPSPNTWVQWTYQEALRTAICRYRAGAVYEDSDASVSYQGTWSTVTYQSDGYDTGSGTSYHKTTTAGSKAIITTPDDMGRFWPGTWVHLGLIGADSGATAEVWLDGVKHGDVDCGRGAAYGTAFGSGSDNTGFRTPLVYRLWIPTAYTDATKLTTTTHTIELRFGATVGSGSFGLQFDYWGIEADVPPLVLLLNMCQPPNPQSIWGALADPAVHDAHNGYLANAVATFADKRVRIVDTDTPLEGRTEDWSVNSNARYFKLDGLHLNEEGAKRVARAVLDEINTATYSDVDWADLSGKWSEETGPLTEPPRWFSGPGLPLGIIDTFNRDPSTAGIGGTGWTEGSGSWGIDVLEQAYIEQSKWSRPTRLDTFTRPNSTTALGTTETGQTWTAQKGTWGIASDKAYLVSQSGGSGTYPVATIPVGSTTQTVEAVISNSEASLYYGVVFRYVDTSNYMVAILNGFFGNLVLYKYVAGTLTAVLTTTDVGGVFHIEVGSDDVVHIFNNTTGKETSAGTYTIVNSPLTSAVGTAVNAGLWANTSAPGAGRWDDFKASDTLTSTTARSAAQNIVTRDVGFSNGVIGFQVGGDGSGDLVSGTGLAYRVQDANNYYSLWMSNAFTGDWVLSKFVSGVRTDLGVTGGWQDIYPGAVPAIVFNGSTHTLYVNGVHQQLNPGGGPQDSITDSTFPTGSTAGLVAPHKQPPLVSRFRDFRAGDYVEADAPVDGDMAIDLGDPTNPSVVGPYSDTTGWPTAVSMRSVPTFGSPKTGSNAYLSMPGFMASSLGTLTLSANVRYFFKLYETQTVAIDQLAIEITTGGAGNIRFGLIGTNEFWQPTGAALADSGSLSAATATVLTHTPAGSFEGPGRMLAVVHASVACTIRVAVGSSLVPTFAASLGSACLHQYFSKSMTFGAIDATAWDTATAAATSELCGVWLRVSGP